LRDMQSRLFKRQCLHVRAHDNRGRHLVAVYAGLNN
jgi:hypothetical protein